MKHLPLILAMLIQIICFNSTSAQMSKFDKWLQSAYFKGFNITVWDQHEKRQVSQVDFDNLKSFGANVVEIQTRGSMNPAPPYEASIYWREDDLIIYQIDMLDTMVNFARNAGLMYIIVVRDGPGRIDVSEDTGQSTIWTNLFEQQLYGRMLREMAARYLPDTLFVGMVLTNEPNPLGELWEPPVATLDSALKANNIDLNGIFKTWIDSVRAVDADLPLIIGSVHADNPEYFSLVQKQADDRIVYVAHMYNPANFSHAQNPYEAQYPGNYWSARLGEEHYFNREFLRDTLYLPLREFQEKHNVPVFIGEYGIRLPQNGGELYLSDIAGIACELGWHFSAWSFNSGPQFNYRLLDSIYGTNYYATIKQYMDCGGTSVKEILPESANMNIYPDPSDGRIFIDTDTPGPCKVNIYNMYGECILDKILLSQVSTIEIDLSAQPAGVYICKILRFGQTITKKIVIN